MFVCRVLASLLTHNRPQHTSRHTHYTLTAEREPAEGAHTVTDRSQSRLQMSRPTDDPQRLCLLPLEKCAKQLGLRQQHRPQALRAPTPSTQAAVGSAAVVTTRRDRSWPLCELPRLVPHKHVVSLLLGVLLTRRLAITQGAAA
eukprot:7206534-Prymnesium_polylepis.1